MFSYTAGMYKNNNLAYTPTQFIRLHTLDIYMNTWKIQRLNKGQQQSSQIFAEHS